MKKTNESYVEFIDCMGSDLTVVNAARVSYHKEAYEMRAKDDRLIEYLAQNGHWSPFAHCFAQFRIKAPIFVARQLVKHQVGLTWNEVSRRYVDEEPEFYIPDEWRGRPTDSKQGSSGIISELVHEEGHEDLWADWDNEWHPSAHVEFYTYNCLSMYNQLLASGVAPEQARMVLPQNTMTEWIWSGSLYAFARVCKQRLDDHAQKETRDVAERISQILRTYFPVAWKNLVN